MLPEHRAVCAGAAAVHHKMRGGQPPVRMRQLATGHGAVVDLVVCRSVLHHDASLEQEGIADRVDAAVAAGLQAYRTAHVIKAAGVAAQVQRAAAGGDLLCRFAAAQAQVAGCFQVAGFTVVVDVVGLQLHRAVHNLYVSVEHHVVAAVRECALARGNVLGAGTWNLRCHGVHAVGIGGVARQVRSVR